MKRLDPVERKALLLYLEREGKRVLATLSDRFPELPLERVELKWVHSTRRAGLARANIAKKRAVILMSSYFFGKPEHARHYFDTLLHEAAHVIHWWTTWTSGEDDHSEEWARIARSIGCSADAAHKMTPRERREKLVSAACESCGKAFKITKRRAKWIKSKKRSYFHLGCGGTISPRYGTARSKRSS